MSHELGPLNHHTPQLQITWNIMELSLEQTKRKSFVLHDNRIDIERSWTLESKAITMQVKKVTRGSEIGCFGGQEMGGRFFYI